MRDFLGSSMVVFVVFLGCTVKVRRDFFGVIDRVRI